MSHVGSACGARIWTTRRGTGDHLSGFQSKGTTLTSRVTKRGAVAGESEGVGGVATPFKKTFVLLQPICELPSSLTLP